MNSISNIKDADNVRVLIQLQNPTAEVINLVTHWPRKNKSIFIVEKDFVNSMSAINNNVYSGIDNAFSKLNAEYCLILEDDIVLMPTALKFINTAFEIYKSDPKFHGVNCFSKMEISSGSEFLVAKSNFGYAWGWAIDKIIFRKLSKFWTGVENNHWDFLVEPFVRTGFVINPFASQVQNIGFDSSATHSSQDGQLGEEMVLSSLSWINKIHTIKESKEIRFEWSESLYDLNFIGGYKKFILFKINFLVFKVNKLERYFPKLEFIRMKLIAYRGKFLVRD